jgi:diguanylate cyclase (GGDEF)-like protein
LDIEHLKNEAFDKVTGSVGFVCRDAQQIDDVSELYKEADRLLYKAKASGRNRVVSNL